MWLFHYSISERNYDVLNSKSPCILLSKNINFNKNETESKMENTTPSFRETNPEFQFIVYWLYFQNIQFFTYQKTLLQTLFCLFLKLLKVFSSSLKLEFFHLQNNMNERNYLRKHKEENIVDQSEKK